MQIESERAAAWGVLPGFQDVRRRWQPTPPGTAAALLAAMGAVSRHPPAAPAIPPGAGVRLCYLHPGLRTWGWTVQLYAVRSACSWGVGDLGDLRRLGGWSRGQGADVLFVNPLHAPLPLTPQQPSPYYPSSRRFRNPLYLRLEDVPGWKRAAAELQPLQREARSLNLDRRLDRDRSWELKLGALEAMWSRFEGDPGLESYASEAGRALQDHARFAALSEVHGGPWRSWPAAYRHPRSPAVEQFARERHQRVGFHAWLQWQLDRQLAAAAGQIGLIGDLAVGVDPAGEDAWADQDLLLPGFTVGAPPDLFSADGQNWQLAAFDPWRLAEAGFAGFRDVLRAGFRHAAGLRIDHVMGLWRLFLIPAGGRPSDGAYLSYPHRHLLDVIAEESQRVKAAVIGEDLGTVDRVVRRELVRRRLLGYRLVWFERRRPARYPVRSLAALTTHDLPTLAGAWTGADVEPGLVRRLQHYLGVRPQASLAEAVEVVHAALAASPSALAAVTLEDALEVVERPNRPGSSAGDWRNWSLALPQALEAIESDPRPARLAAIMAAGGR